MLSASHKAGMLGKHQCNEHCLHKRLPILKLLWLAEARD